jgi:hypothetical protein
MILNHLMMMRVAEMMKARRQERMARREAADKIKESRKAAAVK